MSGSRLVDYKILDKAYTFTPKDNFIDLGVRGIANHKTLTQISALIDRKGYCINAKSPEPPELFADHVLTEVKSQKTGEVNK